MRASNRGTGPITGSAMPWAAGARWDRLRRMVYRRAKDRCEACGAGRDPDVGKWLEAHERWE
ncbi:MAG TPA: hypothetical protein VN888_24880 [Mycobacterium sp.]|nr:hypothetical protein [Mycobacterium sp.]